MKINTDYEVFGSLMTESCLYVNPYMSFRKICKIFRLDRRRLDKMLKSELGMSGCGLIRAYRNADHPRIAFCKSGLAISVKGSLIKGFKLYGR